MTESADTIINYIQSDHNNDVDNPIDWFAVLNQQEEHVDNKFGLFDDDEDSITLLDLKSTPKSHHDLSIFDELAHQCDAVLLATNLQDKALVSTSDSISYLSNTMTTQSKTTVTINEYEQRFQTSLQKLSVPIWYNDVSSISQVAITKPITIPTSHISREPHRTPEIVHVQRPRSYRSCRSSLGTSPSPSVHSWHPNHIIDGMNFPFSLPTSSSTSRRHHKYEKGIERVAKSSHWYRPTQFANKTESNPMSTAKISINHEKKSNDNHYDTPKVYCHDQDNLSSRIKMYTMPRKNLISKSTIQQPSKYLIDDSDFEKSENTNKTMIKSSEITMKNDKKQVNSNQLNELEKMSLTNETKSFNHIELEEITDEEDEDNNKRMSTNNGNYVLSTASQSTNNKDNETNTLLEHIATNLVDTIISEALSLEKLHQTKNNDDDDINIGVRELSDDENGLRELDENDMNGTDEFIVFATKDEPSNMEGYGKGNGDDDGHSENITNNINNQTLSNRGGLNRLYTFARATDDTTNQLQKQSSNQDSSTSELIAVDKDMPETNNSHSSTDSKQPIYTTNYVDNHNNHENNSTPVYRSHIQKRHIDLGRYYDGMMRATNTCLPTHDLRCNLILNNANKTSSMEGVNEETVRQGRMLLDSMPNPMDIQYSLEENHRIEPIQSTVEDQSELIVETNQSSTPKFIRTTTITEEYHRIQRQVVEEISDVGFINEICANNTDSNQEAQVLIQETSLPSVSLNNDSSPYELLAECYSGYSLARSDFITTTTTVPLTLNASSLQSTTDEAYESEPPTTTSPRSMTTYSSSPPLQPTVETHVHPQLLHEFEYPSPPPPVPDRRLKPVHLRPQPPPVKPRIHYQQRISQDYSTSKRTKASPLLAIQHLMTTTSNDSNSESVRTLSSRHYCGSIPQCHEPLTSTPISSLQSPTKTVTNDTLRRDIKPRSSSNPSSTNRTKLGQKTSSEYFDEATNGLAIRLPAAISNARDSTNKQNPNRSLTPSSGKQIDGTTRRRPVSENLHSDRLSLYETSV